MSNTNPWREIKDKLSISEYLADKGFSGKRQGNKIRVTCPFPIHSDSTPSFVIYNDDEYHCYGCASNPAAKNYYCGDIFDLVPEVEGIPPNESLLFLAERVGVPIDGENFEFLKRRIEDYESLKVHQNNYAKNLPNSQGWMSYLQNDRGLNIETISYFELGLNTVTQSVIIPLRDDHAKPLGFTEHNPKAQLKYVNPPTTEFFKKEEFLFNADALRSGLVEENVVYIVEGYFDAMSMWQHGYKQTVAMCMAKLTEGQVKTLKKYINPDTRIVFVPDADKAGWNSLESNFTILRQHVKNPASVITFANAPKEISTSEIKDSNDWFVKTKLKSLPNPVGFFETIVQYHISQTPEDVDVQYNKIQRSLLLATEFEKARVIKILAKLWEYTEDQVAKFLNVSRRGIEENLFKDSTFRINEYIDYVTTLDDIRRSTGLEELDKVIRGFNPGEVLGIMGRSNTCKTLLSTDIFVKQQKMRKDIPTLFFSLEMSSTQLQERMIVQFLELKGDDLISPAKIIEEGVKARDPKIMEALDLIKVVHNKLLVCDRPALTVEDMRRYIDLAETAYNVEIGLVIVDHLHIVKGPGKTDYERTSAAIKDFRAMIRARKSCSGIILIQTSRKGGSGGEPITMEDARGSGEIEETLDFMIGVWRPELKSVTEIERLRGQPLELDKKMKKDNEGRYLKGTDNGRQYETDKEAFERARSDRNRQIQMLSRSALDVKGLITMQVLKSRREGRNAILVYKMHGLGLQYVSKGGVETSPFDSQAIAELDVETNPTPKDLSYVPGKLSRKAKDKINASA